MRNFMPPVQSGELLACNLGSVFLRQCFAIMAPEG